VANLPSSEPGRNFSGIVMGKEVFITHWDSLTKATLIGIDRFFDKKKGIPSAC
jgi:hypothetical protein